MSENPRYIIGIDLGTTNSAVGYVDTRAEACDMRVQALRIPQLVAQGEIGELTVLPSFVYLPEPHDEPQGTLRLPWQTEDPDVVVGVYARDQAAKVPGKVVASAKSWLCYEGLDRRSPCLPYARSGVPRKISPVDASRLYLDHLRAAWNWTMARTDPASRMEEQEIFLTVPASFDAVARELTVEAANAAGLTVRLLEEPQAAFYAWLQVQGDAWRESVSDGDVILVCDIGGGTSDFSLIAVTDQDGDLTLQRLAVGDHTLLGGDNMDLTLAYAMAEKIRQTRNITLDPYQISALTHACRAAKEVLGEGNVTSTQPLAILGRGSGVIAGTITTELSAGEFADSLLDGFFPVCDVTEQPSERRKTGLRAFGLDYAADPGLTRHLAAFVSRHSFRDGEGRPLLPTAILFNGGVTKSPLFRERIVEVLNRWNQIPQREIAILSRHDADLSVALGAAWYGWTQLCGGVRIKAGCPRSYYIGVDSSLPAVPGFVPPMEALCIVNFGLEEGSSVAVPADGIGLLVGEPTEFRFFSSTSRQEDEVGTCLASWAEDELQELPSFCVELPADAERGDPAGTLVPVALRTELTEIGTLEVWCDDLRGGNSWKLQYELRTAEPEETA